MFDIFQYQYLVIAFFCALLTAGSTSILSVFISLKKISYMGEGLAHVSFAGLALAVLLGLNITVTSLIFVIVVALLIGFISRRNNIHESNTTTIFLSVSMALAVIMFNLKQDFVYEASSYLFGDILLVTETDLAAMVVVFVLNLLFLCIFFKELFYITYNQEIAQVFHLPEKLVSYLFLIFLAVNIIITVKIAGIIMITAQLVLPGVSALNFTRKIKIAVLLSFLLAQGAGFSGFFVSYYFQLPPGAAIVLVLFLFFLISLGYKKFLRT